MKRFLSTAALLLFVFGVVGCGAAKNTEQRPAPDAPELTGKEPIVQESTETTTAGE